jgi:D-alanyl-D-alanine carboxypeptidase/D-alanyl-D-alanine-endopeptidase (penicillin-binding protein 4)
MQIQWLIRVALALSASALTPPASLAADSPPPAVALALRAAGIPISSVGISVQEIGSTRHLLSVNPGLPMNPASTMKLVTTFAGLELLGPAYRWRTDVYLGGPLREGVLEGDLILKGSGDPKLTLEAFWLLLRDLRAKGLKDIRGDLVLDRSQFATGEYDASRFDGESLRPYNVGPDPLLLNFKSIRFLFSPDPERGTVRVTAEPRIIDTVSVVRLTEGPCGDWRDRLKPDFQPQAPAPRALFTGSYNASCGERHWHVALLPPTQYAGSLFRLLWGEVGGSITGGARDGALQGEAKPYASIESPALAEVVRDINKFSNNVMARQLYLAIAVEQGGPPATTENGQRAIKAWLAKKGLDFPELVMENGAGLSRIERISAQSLTTLLVAAFRSPLMPELVASLPLVAVDGTMRRRMKGEAIAGQAHIKTGSLADVRSIAGYVLDRGGRQLAVTMIVNHPNAGLAQAAQDALLNWVYAR